MFSSRHRLSIALLKNCKNCIGKNIPNRRASVRVITKEIQKAKSQLRVREPSSEVPNQQILKGTFCGTLYPFN